MNTLQIPSKILCHPLAVKTSSCHCILSSGQHYTFRTQDWIQSWTTFEYPSISKEKVATTFGTDHLPRSNIFSLCTNVAHFTCRWMVVAWSMIEKKKINRKTVIFNIKYLFNPYSYYYICCTMLRAFELIAFWRIYCHCRLLKFTKHS